MQANADIEAGQPDRHTEDSILLRGEIKAWWITNILGSLEKLCIRHRILPNMITLWGVGMFGVVFLLFANNHLLLGGWTVLVAGSLDALDGRVARATGQTSLPGEFLDSVADRFQDFFLFAGLAVHYRMSPILYVVLAALCGSMAVSYARAKADSMNVDLARVGLMQRPERLFLVGFGSMISSVFNVSLMPLYGKGNPPPQHLLILLLMVLAVGTNWTAIKRIRYTMKALKEREAKK